VSSRGWEERAAAALSCLCSVPGGSAPHPGLSWGRIGLPAAARWVLGDRAGHGGVGCKENSPASSPVFGMVPFLNSILGTMLPMLGMAKQDHMKSVFCYGEGYFCGSSETAVGLGELWEAFSLLWKRRDCGWGLESWLGRRGWERGPGGRWGGVGSSQL